MIAASENSPKYIAVSLLLLLAAWAGLAAADEVAVRLFSHRPVQKITILAPGWEVIDAGGRSASAAQCEVVLAGFHRGVTCGDFYSIKPPFNFQPRTSDAAAHLTIRVDNEKRVYSGRLRIEPGRERWPIIAFVPLDDYVAGVVAAEAIADEPEFLQVMAVCARSYARHHLAAGGTGLADDTQSQQFRGLPPPARSKPIREAVAATQGRVLRVNGRVAPAFYHACCGDHTRAAGEIWPEMAAWPHLRGVKDLDDAQRPWCRHDKWFSWRRDVPLDRWRRLLHEKFNALTALRSDPKRAIALVGEDKRRNLAAWPFRMTVCRELGWNTLPSDRFIIRPNRHAVVFEGRGFGHRVGLCQAGALAQVRAGKTAAQVLAFYFPGAQVR